MNSRLDLRDKKRKINRIYNIAIAVVCVLIVLVAFTIFTGKDVSQTSKEQTKSTQTKTTTDEKTVNTNETDIVEPTNEEVVKEEKASTEPELVKVEGGDDSNVLNTYTSESWKPVGTEQTGVHTTTYQKGSTDWNEMTKAIAYGAGIDEASMHLWWLNNGGAPNTAIGTVSAGENPQSYRVYIEWVDGEGWKPVKVEELKKNDKR